MQANITRKKMKAKQEDEAKKGARFDLQERIARLDDQGGVAAAKVEERVDGEGRRRRGRTKHRTKRRTVRPAHIKHLVSRITRLMH